MPLDAEGPELLLSSLVGTTLFPATLVVTGCMLVRVSLSQRHSRHTKRLSSRSAKVLMGSNCECNPFTRTALPYLSELIGRELEMSEAEPSKNALTGGTLSRILGSCQLHRDGRSRRPIPLPAGSAGARNPGSCQRVCPGEATQM